MEINRKMEKNNFKLNNIYLRNKYKYYIYIRKMCVLLLAIKLKIINKEFLWESSVSFVQF
jgi:hypothetical protein